MHHLTLIQAPLRTRADVQQLVPTLVAPLLPHFSPGRANVRLGVQPAWYGEPSDLLKGFSRPLWGTRGPGCGRSEPTRLRLLQALTTWPDNVS